MEGNNDKKPEEKTIKLRVRCNTEDLSLNNEKDRSLASPEKVIITF